MSNPLHILIQPGNHLWHEPTDNAREVLWQFEDFAFSHLEWPSYAWPGGYEIHYIVEDGGVLCHQCANANLMRTIDPDDSQFHIVGSDINYENPDLFCDHCNRQIEPAYGEES